MGRQLVALRLTYAARVMLAPAEPFDPENVKRIVSDSTSYEPTGPPWTVVGIVDDIRFFSTGEESASIVYFPYGQLRSASRSQVFVFRTASSDAKVSAALRDIVVSGSPDSRVDDVFTMTEALRSSMAAKIALTLVAFASIAVGGLALLLASISAYSVTSLSVGHRSAETAIRSAVGASPWTMVKTLVSRDLVWIGAAMVVGIACARLSVVMLAQMVDGIVAPGYRTYTAVVIGVGTSIGVAWFVPLRNAIYANPGAELRSE
jgi:ABC-type antimicrobial peptide transport system permease subunit